MHHLLVHASPARIADTRTRRKLLILELAPRADDLEPFSFVCINQKGISHRKSHSDWLWSPSRYFSRKPLVIPLLHEECKEHIVAERSTTRGNGNVVSTCRSTGITMCRAAAATTTAATARDRQQQREYQ